MNSKYPEGYIPKIKYWMSKLDQATNGYEKAKANSKLAYFVTRHTEIHGPLDLDKLVEK
jgi:hypothetical protein